MVTFHSFLLLSILCSLLSLSYGQVNYGTVPQLGYGGVQSPMYTGQPALPTSQFPGSQWQQPQPQLYGQASVPQSSYLPGMTGAGQFGSATPSLFGQAAPSFQSNPMGTQMGMPMSSMPSMGFPQSFGIGARQLQTTPEQSGAVAGNQMPAATMPQGSMGAQQPETAASQSQTIPMILTPQGVANPMAGGYSPYGTMPMNTGTQGFMPNQMQTGYPYSTMTG